MTQRKLFFVITCICFFSGKVFSQKKNLDFSTYKIWPVISAQAISNDGRYVSYVVNTPKDGSVLYVQDVEQSRQRILPGISTGEFTEDSRQLLFITPYDSLGILDLALDTIYYIAGVSGYQVPKDGNGIWLAFLIDKGNELVLLNLANKQEKHFQGITEYQFNDSGSVLCMKSDSAVGGIPSSTIVWLNLATGQTAPVYHGIRTGNLVFNRNGNALGFFTSDSSGTLLRYYRNGMDSAVKLVDTSLYSRTGMAVSSGNLFFNKDGSRILFGISKSLNRKDKTAAAGVSVFIRNYEDELITEQKDEEYGSLLTMVDLNGNGLHTFNPMLQKYERFRLFGSCDHQDYIIVEKLIVEQKVGQKVGFGDKVDLYFVSLTDGQRRLMKKGADLSKVTCSGTGKYITWFDIEKKQWFAYNVVSGLTRNITQGIKATITEESGSLDHPADRPAGLAGWYENDSAVIIQGRYDLWRVDPEGIRAPINLSRGGGLKTHIRSRWISFHEGVQGSFHFGDTLILSAFDDSTKDNGFFSLILDKQGTLKKLVLEPRMYYYYNASKFSSGSFYPFYPVKAKFANKYLVERMGATEYPNLYVSDNLATFRALTSFSPQKDYNWITAELYHWKLPNGMPAAGVLYKPEDFNPQKKYPVIFFYYEKYSDDLHYFIHPFLSDGTINIPWFVSNGYLVFVPDIHYSYGYPGRSALEYVSSAAHFLSKKTFVDYKHMGLQGHSFGGFETNYIVSRTSIFAAAAPGAGEVNIISGYGAGPEYYEHGQGRIGATIWSHPELYIENSSFFRADKVTTSILIMHNFKDPNVPFGQGLQWFNGLARLGKKVWMLSYDGEGHAIAGEKNQLDYSIRLGQFFDHFLKAAPPPKWMTKAVTRDLQGVQSSLELDYRNSEGSKQ